MGDIKKIHTNCQLQIFQSAKSTVTQTCTVRLGATSFDIDYIAKGERVFWRCTEKAPGHYECCTENTAISRRGSLHQFHKGIFFEGYWTTEKRSNSSDGMWRITLGKPQKATK